MERLCEEQQLGEALNAVGKFRVSHPDSYKAFIEIDDGYVEYMRWLRQMTNPNGSHDKAAKKFYNAVRKARVIVKRGGGSFDKLFPAIAEMEQALRGVTHASLKAVTNGGQAYHKAMMSAKWPVPEELLKDKKK